MKKWKLVYLKACGALNPATCLGGIDGVLLRNFLGSLFGKVWRICIRIILLLEGFASKMPDVPNTLFESKVCLLFLMSTWTDLLHSYVVSNEVSKRSQHRKLPGEKGTRWEARTTVQCRQSQITCKTFTKIVLQRKILPANIGINTYQRINE